MDDAYAIGEVIWSNGDQLTVCSHPKMIHGAWFQDAKYDDGRVVCIISKGQAKKNISDSRKAWAVQQSEFRRLHE